jgi:hypothetical protein
MVQIEILGKRYELDGLGSITSSGKTFFLFYGDQADSGVHPHAHMTGNGVKRQGREAGQSSPSSVVVKNGGAIPPTPRTSSWRSAQYRGGPVDVGMKHIDIRKTGSVPEEGFSTA